MATLFLICGLPGAGKTTLAKQLERERPALRLTPDEWIAPLLADASVDRFFICDTWHHINGHAKYLALLKRMLKPGGQVIMVDFKKATTPVGPPMEMRIDRDDLVREMETNGFQLAAEHTFLEYQYFLVFKVK